MLVARLSAGHVGCWGTQGPLALALGSWESLDFGVGSLLEFGVQLSLSL